MYYVQLFVIVIYIVHLSNKLSGSIYLYLSIIYLSFYLSVVLLFYHVICLTVFLVVSSAESQFW